jgi:hypothetical protein
MLRPQVARVNRRCRGGDCSLTGFTPRASVEPWAFRSPRTQAPSRGTAVSMIWGASNRVHRCPRSRIWAAASSSTSPSSLPARAPRPVCDPLQPFRPERRTVSTIRRRTRSSGERLSPPHGGQDDEGAERRRARKDSLNVGRLRVHCKSKGTSQAAVTENGATRNNVAGTLSARLMAARLAGAGRGGRVGADRVTYRRRCWALIEKKPDGSGLRLRG